MKQVFIRKVKVIVDKVPAPLALANEVLVHVYYSCISSGTELSGIISSGKPLYKKIIVNQQNIKKVSDLLKNKVDIKAPIGYLASGLVLEIGDDIKKI